LLLPLEPESFLVDFGQIMATERSIKLKYDHHHRLYDRKRYGA
jgi:hypothetical protein